MARGRKKKTAEQAAPSIGHNDLTDDQKTALLLQGVGKIERLQKQSAEIAAAMKAERKKLKADGFPKEEVDYALFLRKADPDKAVSVFTMQARIAKWLAHPVGFQSDLLGDGVDRTPSVDKAFAEGRVSGLAGDACVVPPRYAPGSEQHGRWMEGWHEAQASLMEGFKPLGEPKGAGDDADAPGSYTVQ